MSVHDAPTEAPEKPLPHTPYYSVEYPGYVQDSSVPLAVSNLGGQEKLDQVFRRSAPRSEAILELSLNPGSPFAHPIPGNVVGTNNLVLKIVKRRRKGKDLADAPIGEYTAEVVGVGSKVARFRSQSLCHSLSCALLHVLL